MAPSRGKGKATARAKTSIARRSGRNRAHEDDVPDVYQSMLQEADDQSSDDHFRPLKKRRVAATESTRSKAPASTPPSATKPEPRHVEKPASNLQTVEDSSESDNSDIEFEDVDLGHTDQAFSDDAENSIEDLSISIQAESSTKRSGGQPRRKPATYAEKAHRLMVHKLHILCLLGHSMYVNGWCSNAAVQKHLRPILNTKTVSYLNPKAEFSQFQRNRSFQDGLKQAADTFSAEFQIVARGLQRPHWDVDGESTSDKDYAAAMDRADFIAAAKDLAGSQDVGNQLFCALLRSVNVQARLVCSLQTLPFGSVPKASTPKKPVKQKIMAFPPETAPSSGYSDEDSALTGSKISAIRRRLGAPVFSESAPQPPPKKAKPVPKLAYPVYWVEAFNTAHQKWVTVDPIVTHSVNQPAKLEPPASYHLNQLTYVVAFESNGAARDVTKRYAKAFNAKTRRQRVESSNDGARWMKKAMRIFRRSRGLLDRDQVEDAELAAKEAREGMPANVLDFKDHPYYALERHLKRHEVIHPMREVGKVNAGTAAKPRMEAVYRRQDLLACKSSDKWYRCGREIKPGEQPLKHITRRARRQRSVDDDHEGEIGDVTSTGLYAPHQTQAYVPPPVERGRVPRNAYGNLDIYVPSMVPAGGTHLRHKLTKDAARLLRVDFAEAVTGFSFKGRQGTAIVEGAVVATQFAEAVQAVIDGFEDQVVEDESRVRSLEALRLWKRFMIGLRIIERVSEYGDAGNEMDVGERSEGEGPAVAPGGFFPGVIGEEEHAMPTAGRFSVAELRRRTNTKRKVRDDDSEEEALVEADEVTQPDQFYDAGLAGGFMPADDGIDEGMSQAADNSGGGGFLPGIADGGGGFLIEDDGDELLPDSNAGGGGFLIEDNGGNSSNDHASGGFLCENDEHMSDTAETQAVETDSHIDHLAADHNKGNESAASAASEAQETFVDPDVDMDVEAQTQTQTSERDTAPLQQTHMVGDTQEPDDGSDKGSLLSHDPDDEDAEPDWLESD